MYHALVRRRARAVFDRLSAGDWEAVVNEWIDHVTPAREAAAEPIVD